MLQKYSDLVSFRELICLVGDVRIKENLNEFVPSKIPRATANRISGNEESQNNGIFMSRDYYTRSVSFSSP